MDLIDLLPTATQLEKADNLLRWYVNKRLHAGQYPSIENKWLKKSDELSRTRSEGMESLFNFFNAHLSEKKSRKDL